MDEHNTPKAKKKKSLTNFVPKKLSAMLYFCFFFKFYLFIYLFIYFSFLKMSNMKRGNSFLECFWPLHGQFFNFFSWQLKKKKKKKAKNWTQCSFVRQTPSFFFFFFFFFFFCLSWH